MLHKFGHLTAVGVYDRRADTAGFNNVDNGDMVAGGIVTPLMNKNWILGLLWVHWFNHYNGPDISGVTYPLSRVDIFSPYLDGKIGPVTFKTGFNDFADGSVTTPARDQIFSGNMFGSSGWSEYFRVGTTMGKLTAQAQFVGVENGGLISPGFDTFSSMINSSPESTTNPTSVYNMGNPGPQNLGLMGSKQYLYIGRLTYKATDKVSLRGSVGVLDVKSPTTTGGVISDSSMVYDAQASYQINKIVRTWVTLGWLGANKAALLQGNSLIGTFPNAETGTNNPYAGEASFAHHGVFAASLNLGVKF